MHQMQPNEEKRPDNFFKPCPLFLREKRYFETPFQMHFPHIVCFPCTQVIKSYDDIKKVLNKILY